MTSDMMRSAQNYEPVNRSSSMAQQYGQFGRQCHSCCDIVVSLQQRVLSLERAEEMRTKKKNSKEAKCVTCVLQTGSDQLVKEKLTELVTGSGYSLSRATSKLLQEVFTTEELMTSSVMGVAGGKALGNPALDAKRRSMIEDILMNKFETSIPQIRAIIRDRLKLIRKKYGGLPKGESN